jgi:predicted transcriptional regulator
MQIKKLSSRLVPPGILAGRASEINMPEEPPSASLGRGLTTNIVAAYVRKNQIAPDQLATLISTVHAALSGLGKSKAETEMERTPAVPIRRSVHRDYVVCLECGWRGQMLKRHITTGHGLTVAQYHARWNLSRAHEITAPGYSERRSGLAKQIGLGRDRRHPVKNQSRSQPKPRQHRNSVLGDEEGPDRLRPRPKIASG